MSHKLVRDVTRLARYVWHEAIGVLEPAPLPTTSQRAHFGISDRLTLIFGHYFFGPIIGLRLRLFVPDRYHNEVERWVALLLIALGVAMAVISTMPVGLVWVLFVCCPQWLYAFTPIQHTIFEYRGYIFIVAWATALGLAASITPLAALLVGCLAVCYTVVTRRRNLIYSDPLLFWKQAHLDVQTDPLLASAYIYQLQKRERFGEVDDLYRWMTAARIPDCRAFLLNLAAAKFGSKTDSATLDREKMEHALAILEETARRWPDHEDVWRNLGTVQYYLATLGMDNYKMTRAITSFTHALTIQSEDSLTYLSLGHCYMYEGQWRMAVMALTRAYNFLPAGAYIVEDISLVRIKLMEALESAANHTANEEEAKEYRREFARHQQALEKHFAWYVTDENAQYLV